MGCVGSCFLHCLKRSPCCICGCCYGATKKAYWSYHQTDKGQTVFNSPFQLILYDKWCKESDVYQHKEELFQTLVSHIITNKNEVKNRIILDAGCGTGAFTEALCKTFMLGNDDTLICMDTSPQCLHFVRTRVVDRTEIGKNYHVEYFNNDNNALCLDSNYGDNELDIIFMAFVINHIAVKNGDRHNIFKELYKTCKPGGSFIVIEHGIEFLREFDNEEEEEKQDASLLKDEGNDIELRFRTCEALQQFVEGFGFVLESRLMQQTFGDRTWVLLFTKPN